MILVCGEIADINTELVCARLADCGYAYRLIDLAHYPDGYQVCWRLSGGQVEGYIATQDWQLDLANVQGVFVRFSAADQRPPLDGIDDQLAPLLYDEHNLTWMALFEQLGCPVVNRRGDGMSNHSKPYQAVLIRECGLKVPPTLVTSDPEAAARFYEEHNGEVIFKSLSGVRSIVRKLDTAQMERLPLLRNAPVQLQAYIAGQDIRAHTVGNRIFAIAISSTSVDYRYSWREGGVTRMVATKLPTQVEAACLRLASRLQLLLTGIDLKVTTGGEYYCFEANPSPAFAYYELGCGQPISLALAELLQFGSGHPN